MYDINFKTIKIRLEGLDSDQIRQSLQQIMSLLSKIDSTFIHVLRKQILKPSVLQLVLQFVFFALNKSENSKKNCSHAQAGKWKSLIILKINNNPF